MLFTSSQVITLLALLSSTAFGKPKRSVVVKNQNIVSVPVNFPIVHGESRIYGGQEAQIGEFPYQVSIRTALFCAINFFLHTCGGSIISNRFVVTAAHCKICLSSEDYQVVVGAHKKNGGDGVAYNVARFIAHEDFGGSKISNDIALIETTIPIGFNKLVAPIALNPEFIEDGVDAITSGWGDSNDKISNLKLVHLMTLTNDDCRRAIAGADVDSDNIYDFGTLCAFSGKVGHGVCFGDSGGPLVADNKLIGLTSWGIPCAHGFPDGYTRISTYVPWINNTINSIL